MESYPAAAKSSTSRLGALGKAALGYAKRGVPVFPLRPGTKEPLHGTRGFYDATTDEQQIRRWWSALPDANIAVPTGQWTGILVLDVDHPASLDALEDEHGRLPETATTATGNGGMHYLFAHPAGETIRNSAGKLGEGLDVRGEGGYIVAPPSRTARAYEWLDKRPLAAPPEWLLEALREPQGTRRKDAKARTGTGGPPREDRGVPDPGYGVIPEGTRDDTLTRIAGSLHDGTRTLEDLTAKLLEINAAWCSPPLEERQVEKIARSIHGRDPCRPRATATPEAREFLERVEAGFWRRDHGGDWRGVGGKSDRDAYAALIVEAREHGTLTPGGVRVSISVRAWALRTAVSKRAMLDYRKNGERKPGIISRLKRRGLIRSDNAAQQSSEDSGAFVLTLPSWSPLGSAEFHHSSIGLVSRGGGETLRAPRLRWSAPRYDRVGAEMVRTTIRRLGKGCGAVLDALDAAGGTLRLKELAGTLNNNRARDLRRRTISRLEEAGVVECFGESISLTRDWLDALDCERERAGEIAAERRDRERYNREREAYRNRHRIKPEPVPEYDGEIRELEPVEDAPPELVEALACYLDRHPHRSGEKPSWYAVALWADGYLPSKPQPGAVGAALVSLGVAA